MNDEHHDASIVLATMGFSSTTECLILDFRRGSFDRRIHILYWDWFLEDYAEALVERRHLIFNV